MERFTANGVEFRKLDSRNWESVNESILLSLHGDGCWWYEIGDMTFSTAVERSTTHADVESAASEAVAHYEKFDGKYLHVFFRGKLIDLVPISDDLEGIEDEPTGIPEVATHDEAYAIARELLSQLRDCAAVAKYVGFEGRVFIAKGRENAN